MSNRREPSAHPLLGLQGNNEQAKSGNGSADIGGAVLRPAKGNEYRPTDEEPFMNERQRDYFRQKLLSWREDILNQVQETLQHLQDENQNHPDVTDRASSETNRGIELRARERQRWWPRSTRRCIGSPREPTSTAQRPATRSPSSGSKPVRSPRLSVEAQERHERRERIYRDD